MADRLLLVLAGLMGACGVVLAAVAAHGKPGAGLDNAALMLLMHALAIIGATALTVGGRLWHPAGLLARLGWVAGAVLFAGDIALRASTGHRFFPMAAPTGGSLLILSWLVFVVAATARGRR